MVVEFKELVKMLKEEKRKGKKVVLATGTFDLFHYEHLVYLKGAKEHGDILVVGIKSNKCAALKDPTRPVIDEVQRAEIVDNLKCVDYVYLVDYNENLELEVEAENSKQEEWLKIFQDSFKELKPDILYYEINHKLQTARNKVFEKYGIEGVAKVRGKGSSTTEIIEKISKMSKS